MAITNGNVSSSMARGNSSDDCPNLVHELFQKDGTWWVQFVLGDSADEPRDTVEFSLATGDERIAKFRLGRSFLLIGSIFNLDNRCRLASLKIVSMTH